MNHAPISQAALQHAVAASIVLNPRKSSVDITDAEELVKAYVAAVKDQSPAADRLGIAADLLSDIKFDDDERATDMQYAYNMLLSLLGSVTENKGSVEVSSGDVANWGNLLVAVCHGAAASSGWWKDTETGEDVRLWPAKFLSLWIGTKLALVHSEVSEGLEGHRKGLMDDKLPHRPMLEVELADAVIRICDLAGGLDMDLGGAIAEKIRYNAHRPDHKIENRTSEGGKSF